MTLPTKTKTWTYSVNRAWGGYGYVASPISDGGDVIFQLKDALTSIGGTFPWTVVATCGYNGATFVTNVSGDNWANASWVRGNNSGEGTDHSWVVLRQNQIATNFEMLLSYWGTQNYSSFHVTYAWDGFDLTGVGPTVDPNPSTVRMVELATAPLPSRGDFTPAQGRLHVMMSNDGLISRWVFTRDGYARIWSGVEVPAEAATWLPGESNPAVVWWDGWVDQLGLTYDYMNDNAKVYTWHTALGQQLSMYMTCVGTDYVGNAVALGQRLTYADNQTDEWAMYPIGLACETLNAKGGRRGKLTDLWWGSAGMPTVDAVTYPATPSPTKAFTQFDEVVFPWDGTLPLTWR